MAVNCEKVSLKIASQFKTFSFSKETFLKISENFPNILNNNCIANDSKKRIR
jgi:hypothetical protein